ncbi:hypothetical protein C2G38_2160965 [Gigaspora rosea]|uniref:Uncharacterized protein n=1 Tax=Gigaspora rosea TaxID=44941 RepID=A0A397W1W9_9GLOM|nr:hypothetical protein C2G38_2160965 [Gigaspora rosea]
MNITEIYHKTQIASESINIKEQGRLLRIEHEKLVIQKNKNNVLKKEKMAHYNIGHLDNLDIWTFGQYPICPNDLIGHYDLLDNI